MVPRGGLIQGNEIKYITGGGTKCCPTFSYTFLGFCPTFEVSNSIPKLGGGSIPTSGFRECSGLYSLLQNLCRRWRTAQVETPSAEFT